MVNKPRSELERCVHCGQGYAGWQFEIIWDNEVCVNCSEPIILEGEING